MENKKSVIHIRIARSDIPEQQVKTFEPAKWLKDEGFNFHSRKGKWATYLLQIPHEHNGNTYIESVFATLIEKV